MLVGDRQDSALGVKRAAEVEREILECHAPRFFDQEWHHRSVENEAGSTAIDFQALQVREGENHPLESLVVVADKQVMLTGVFGPEIIPTRWKRQLARLAATGFIQCRSDARRGVAAGGFRAKGSHVDHGNFTRSDGSD
jgi:hypothetical protein